MMRLWLILFAPIFLLVYLIGMVRYVYNILVDPKEAWKIAISHDQLANAVFNGHEDETISSRAGRHCRDSHPEDKETWACLLCKVLDKLDKDHCKKSIGV